MRRIMLLPMLLLTFSLAGCGAGTKVGQFIDAAAAPIANPVKQTNIYQVKLTFNIAVRGANKWADFCWSKTYVSITADPIGKYICVDRRQTRRMLSQSADKANAAIRVADTFIRNNPTITPIQVIDDAWIAVTDYQKLVTPIVP